MISEEYLKSLKSAIYAFGEFRLKEDNRQLFRNSELAALAAKASEVLLALIKAGGKLLTKGEILGPAWPEKFVEEANLTHHLPALRRSLGEDRNGRQFIETIPRQGCRFAAEVSRAKKQRKSSSAFRHLF